MTKLGIAVVRADPELMVYTTIRDSVLVYDRGSDFWFDRS